MAEYSIPNSNLNITEITKSINNEIIIETNTKYNNEITHDKNKIAEKTCTNSDKEITCAKPVNNKRTFRKIYGDSESEEEYCNNNNSKRLRPMRKVTFNTIDVYHFHRRQGFSAVPLSGGVTLGMENSHHEHENLTLIEFIRKKCCLRANSRRRLLKMVTDSTQTGEEGESSTNQVMEDHDEIDGYYLKRYPMGPVALMYRSKLLKRSGISIIDKKESCECQELRDSRVVCGCRCINGICLPESCSCIMSGIGCQVDSNGRPCNCMKSTCSNQYGFSEYNYDRVQRHIEHTLHQNSSPSSSALDQAQQMTSASEWNTTDTGSCRKCIEHDDCINTSLNTPTRQPSYTPMNSLDSITKVKLSLECRRPKSILKSASPFRVSTPIRACISFDEQNASLSPSIYSVDKLRPKHLRFDSFQSIPSPLAAEPQEEQEIVLGEQTDCAVNRDFLDIVDNIDENLSCIITPECTPLIEDDEDNRLDGSFQPLDELSYESPRTPSPLPRTSHYVFYADNELPYISTSTPTSTPLLDSSALCCYAGDSPVSMVGVSVQTDNVTYTSNRASPITTTSASPQSLNSSTEYDEFTPLYVSQEIINISDSTIDTSDTTINTPNVAIDTYDAPIDNRSTSDSDSAYENADSDVSQIFYECTPTTTTGSNTPMSGDVETSRVPCIPTIIEPMKCDVLTTTSTMLQTTDSLHVIHNTVTDSPAGKTSSTESGVYMEPSEDDSSE